MYTNLRIFFESVTFSGSDQSKNEVLILHALEMASVEMDIKPFAAFIAWLVQEGMNGTPVAKLIV